VRRLAIVLTLAAAAEGGAAAQTAGVASPQATALIVGRVVDAATSRPVAGAIVRVAAGSPGGAPVSADAPGTAMTNAQGEFLFRSLAGGAYGLTVQASGYIPAAYGQRRPQGTADVVRVDAGARITDVSIRMWRYGAITGVVRDESGEPVVDATVRLLRRATVMGRRQLVPILPASDRTDDRGVYRLGSLAPGEYALVVPSSTTTALPAQGLDAQRAAALANVGLLSPAAVSGVRVGDWQVAAARSPGLAGGGPVAPNPGGDGPFLVYPTVFHPSTVRPSEAAIITVNAGEERRGIDIQLPLVPSLRITGTISAPGGAVPPNLRLQLVTADTGLALGSGFETATAVPAPDGRFAFLGVPAGQYLIKALFVPAPVAVAGPGTQSALVQVGNVFSSVGTRPPPAASSDPTLWAEMPVTLADEPVDEVPVVLRTGARLRGRVEFDGGPAPPPPDIVQRMYFGFETVSGMPASLPLGRIDAEAQFTTPELPPGRYLVRMLTPGLPEEWTLESFLVAGRNAADEPFELGTQDVNDIVITYTTRAGEISGTVQRPMTPGATDAGAVVVLMPADVRDRLASGARDRTQIVDVLANGGFRLPRLPAAEYLVAAVDATALPIDVHDTATLAGLTRIATRVTLGRGDRRALTLSVGDIR
jgi:protocatechuate 3,4-dioxygenase beta subunit